MLAEQGKADRNKFLSCNLEENLQILTPDEQEGCYFSMIT